MKKIITIGMCLFICLFASRIFALGIISTNGGFEIEGSGAGAATAAGWSGTPDSALSRTDAAAHSGSWSMELLGGHWDWSHCTQAYNEEDYVGKEIFATVWVMSPSNSSAVAVNDQFGNNSVIFKLEEAGTIPDWREPDIIRVAPVPLYNSFDDCWQFVSQVKSYLGD